MPAAATRGSGSGRRSEEHDADPRVSFAASVQVLSAVNVEEVPEEEAALKQLQCAGPERRGWCKLAG